MIILKEVKNIAKTTGVILHPVVLALFGVFLIVYNSTNDFQKAIYWTGLSSIFALIIGAFVMLGVNQGFFNNLDVSNRKQRVILYPFAILIVILFGIFVILTKGPLSLIAASVIFIIALLVMDLINHKVKASVHVASVTAFCTGIVFVYGINLLPVVALVPVVALARIVEKRHTLKEVIVGGFCGFALTMLGIYVVQFILGL